MAAADTGAHAWASKYDPLCRGRDGASGLMECASVAVVAAGQVTDLLHATAVNHAKAASNPQSTTLSRPRFPRQCSDIPGAGNTVCRRWPRQRTWMVAHGPCVRAGRIMAQRSPRSAA
jgi:hypothetical protein